MTRLVRALVRVAAAVWAWLCRAGDRWDAAVAEALAVADETPSEVGCPPRLTVGPIIGKTGRGVKCHDCCVWLLDSQTSDDLAELQQWVDGHELEHEHGWVGAWSA